MFGLFDHPSSSSSAASAVAPRVTGCHTVVRPLIESLETRLVMSASVTAAEALPAFALGGNLQAQSENSRDHALADLVKSSSGFRDLSGSMATVDSNGWATEDFTIPLWTGVRVDPGQYRISFSGPSNTSVSLIAGSGTLENVSSSSSSIRNWTLDIPSGSTSTEISLKFTGTSGQVKDLKVLQPGSAAGQVWSTKYVDFLKSLDPDTIRVMDIVKTNYNTTSSWAERPRDTDATWYENGVPWEHLIALANDLGSNIWIPVPARASDDYIRQLAALVKTRLNSNLNAYVEYANETWSALHEPGKYNLEQAKAEVAANPDSNLNYDGVNDSNHWQFRRNARRLKEIVELFKSVWTTTYNGTTAQADPTNTRVKGVLGGRASQSEWFDNMLNYINDNYGAPKNYFYGIGGAWYFSMNKYRDQYQDGQSTLTKEEVLEGLDISVTLYEDERRFERAANKATPWGLKLAAYELGVDTMGELNIDAKAAAHNDTRMGDLMERFVRAFQDQAGVVAPWYTVGARRFDLPSGAWTVTDNLNRPNSPKAVAFRNLRAGATDPEPSPAQDIVLSSNALTVPEGGSASFNVQLAAQPTSNVVVTVAKAANGDPDLTTTTTSLTFTPTNWNSAQSVPVAAAQDADATDGVASFALSSSGLATRSVEVTEEDNDTQGIVLSTADLTVPEGGSASFTVKLAAQPTNDLVVSVAKPTSGDPDLTTATSSLTFTAANWNVAQSVSIAAAEDDDTTDGAASFTLSSPGLTGKTVNATEADNDASPPPPSTADPVTLRAVADAYVRDGSTYQGTNFGSASQLQVKAGSAGWNRYTYLRFDLPQGSAVASAKLRLFGRLDNTSAASAGFDVRSSSNTIWSESGLTWLNKPAISTGAALASGSVVGTSGKWYELDVTDYLKTQAAAGATAVTLVLTATAASPSNILFDSDEATNKPQLVVTAEAAEAPAQGLVVSTSSLTVPEGASASFTVKLAAQPTTDVLVAVAKASGGDGDLSTATGSLTFTSANWNTAQSVSIAAAQDGDTTNGTASFTLSSAGLTGKTVAATEVDDDQAEPPPASGSITLSAVADAYVRDGSTYAGQNFGTATQLQVKKGNTGWNRDAYLRFDLSSVAGVGSAKLRLFGKLDNTSAASAGFTIYNAANTSWAETGITWNNRPAAGTTARGAGTVTGTTGGWYELDLTSFLQAEKAAGRNLVTLVLKPTSTSPSNILFDSEEATNKPQLVVSPTGSTTLRAAADTYVRDGATYAGINFGNASQLQVKQGSAGWNREAYLRFDLSSLAGVGSATLRLFGRLDNTSAASAGFTVYNSANTTWSETGVTWNSKLTAGTTVRGAGTVSGTTGKWYELDLTDFIEAEKAAGRDAVTLVLRASASSPSNILFDSDEATNKPQLVVSA